jgi:protein phosphatase
VRREEIATLASSTRDLDGLAEQLIAVANERGGPDNITVVLARFEGEGLAPPDAGSDVGYKSLAGDEGEDENDEDEDRGALPVTGESPAVPREVPQPASSEPAPAPEPEPLSSPPGPPTRRSGSPAAIAGLTAGLLILLVILYFLLRN